MGRAIVRDPQVFLFDEPLSNLDAKLRVAMRSEIKGLHQRLKTTSVYVTHDQIEAMTMGDRIVVMKDGRIEQVGTPLELYDHPANVFVAGFIGSPAMNFVPATLRRSGATRASSSTTARAWRAAGAGGSDGQPVVFGTVPSTCAGEPGGIARASSSWSPPASTPSSPAVTADRDGGGLPRAPRLRARQHHPPQPDLRAPISSTPAAATARRVIVARDRSILTTTYLKTGDS